ncbi:MAG: Gfo/Idh/MocA family oxidoreductase [Armatimonadetes bacterium]|nr:Gfo/Idh/MocA family oxidoreductase [Armatimonadota bacterium]
MADKPLGVGLIGCGDIAPTHAKGLAEAKAASLVACMDLAEASARSLGEEYGVPWSTELQEMLARPEVELVTIATPAFTHDELAAEAAKAGRHVLCEKPLAADLADADSIIASCERAGVALSTCFPLRYLGAARWFQELLSGGALGDVIEIRLRNMGEKKESYWTGGFSGRTVTDWRKSRAQSGGGIIITNLIHHIDLARGLTGLEVTRVFGEMGTFCTPVEVEDLGLASLRYDNNAIGLVEGSSCFFGGSGEHDVNILGTKGQFRFGLWSGKAEAFLAEGTGEPPAGEWVTREFEDSIHADFYDELAAALRGGKQPPVTGLDGRKALEVVLAIYRSANDSKPVRLPL